MAIRRLRPTAWSNAGPAGGFTAPVALLRNRRHARFTEVPARLPQDERSLSTLGAIGRAEVECGETGCPTVALFELSACVSVPLKCMPGWTVCATAITGSRIIAASAAAPRYPIEQFYPLRLGDASEQRRL